MAVNKADIEFIDKALNSACGYHSETEDRFKIIRKVISSKPSSIDMILITTQLIKIRRSMENESYNIDQARKRFEKVKKEVG